MVSRSPTENRINQSAASLECDAASHRARLDSPFDRVRTVHTLKTERIPVMLASYSIRAKITAVVALLLVAMSGMGLLAVRNMRAINASTVDIATNWLPSVRVVGELRAGVITYRNVIREHLLAETLEEKLAAEKTLAGVVESNMKIRQTSEPLVTSPEERALYNQWSDLWDKYKKGTEEVMAL